MRSFVKSNHFPILTNDILCRLSQTENCSFSLLPFFLDLTSFSFKKSNASINISLSLKWNVLLLQNIFSSILRWYSLQTLSVRKLQLITQLYNSPQRLSRFTFTYSKMMSWCNYISLVSSLTLNEQNICFSKGFIKPFANSEDL